MSTGRIMAVPHLLDAVFDDDEVTAQHVPPPELLHEARAHSTGRSTNESVSGVAFIHHPPPPPSQRKVLPLHSLRALRDLYASYIGPAARPLLLNAISTLNATPERFPQVLTAQLLNALCACFDDPKAGRAFFEDAVRLLDEE